tara:strand:+ start:1421 stop:2263 length:843 start_codon:yes stop_codon:yes gene_type:complete
MKKILLLLIIPFLSFGQDLTYVPDNNFEQALIDLGYDDVIDNYVLTENINTVTSLSLLSLGINDLTGIEDFLSLMIFSCNGNNLIEVNLSNNVKLVNLQMNNNNLDMLDISYNTNLIRLECVENNLEQLNVSNNTLLEYLNCHNNSLPELDVSNNILLKSLRCHRNLLTELDVSNNTSLDFLVCNENDINCIQVWDVEYAIIAEEACEDLMYDNEESCFYKDPGAIWSLDCEAIMLNEDKSNGGNSLLKKIDLLGRQTANKVFQLHIYNDGSVEKKYIIQ